MLVRYENIIYILTSDAFVDTVHFSSFICLNAEQSLGQDYAWSQTSLKIKVVLIPIEKW